MTALEVYDLTTKGGGHDFALVIEACESIGPYCLIGGLAVNCYVEPVYTLDADLVLVGDSPVVAMRSQLNVQFNTDSRYHDFPDRVVKHEVLGAQVNVASLPDIVQGKLWAYQDPTRGLSKRKKDELDLIRIAESYPERTATYPPALLAMLRG